MKISLKNRVVVTLAALTLFTSACTKKTEELGTEANPVKLHFVPSVDAKLIEDNSKVFKSYLEKNTPYKFDVTIPQSYIAVVEAFGTKRADVATLNTFGYILAHEKYGVEARLTLLRHGLDTYQSQFIVRAGSPIKTIEDLAGKKIVVITGDAHAEMFEVYAKDESKREFDIKSFVYDLIYKPQKFFAN